MFTSCHLSNIVLEFGKVCSYSRAYCQSDPPVLSELQQLVLVATNIQAPPSAYGHKWIHVDMPYISLQVWISPNLITSKPFRSACPPEQFAPQSQSPPTHKYQRWRRAAYGTAPPRHRCFSGLGRLWGRSSPLRFFGHSRTIFITPFIHVFDKRLSVHIADTVCFL